MTRATALSVVLFLSLGLAACGDKAGGGGGGGVVGAWTIDLGPLMDAALVQAQAAMQSRVDEAPEEQREMIKNLLPNKDKLMEQIKTQYSSMKALIEFKADHTVTHNMEMGGKDKETGDGTWAQSGDQITVTPRTHNGKPVEGEAAEPKLMTFKDGTLSMKPGPEAPVITFRRK